MAMRQPSQTPNRGRGWKTRSELIDFCERAAAATRAKGARGEYATYTDLKQHFLDHTSDKHWQFQCKHILRSYYQAYCVEIRLMPGDPPILAQVYRERREAIQRVCEYAQLDFGMPGRM